MFRVQSPRAAIKGIVIAIAMLGAAASTALAGSPYLTVTPGQDRPLNMASPQPYDVGDRIGFYRRAVAGANRYGLTVRISGTCMDNCTLRLGARKVCMEPDAELWFNAPTKTFYVSEWPDLRQKSAWRRQAMLRFYPRRVRDWVLRTGALDSIGYSGAHVLTARDAAALGVPTCG